MAGYVIADIDVHDAEAYDEYRKLVGPTIAKYGGRIIVRGGPHEVIEGDWVPHRVRERRKSKGVVQLGGVRPCPGHSAEGHDNQRNNR